MGCKSFTGTRAIDHTSLWSRSPHPAVSMLAYSYAASGDKAKAHCIKEWYFGQRGVETPSPREISIEMGVAENLDAAKYHVEGVILGVADKACATATQLK